MPRIAIMVGEHRDRYSSQAVACEMDSIPAHFDISFIDVVERTCTKRCVAKPYYKYKESGLSQ